MDRLLHMLVLKNVVDNFKVVLTKQKYLLTVYSVGSYKSMAYQMIVCCYKHLAYYADVLAIPGIYVL